MGVTDRKVCNCQSEVHGESSASPPKKGKMKVLKKIKKKMGLSSRSSGSLGCTNNLPPLQFHGVHGDNVRLSRDGTVAKRVESFCKGIAFSSRPVKVNEKVCVRFSEVSTNWSGVLRFGFTSNDPSGFRCGLPKYACPDLTNKPGCWAKALPERFCNRGTILTYYVTQAGDVHFGIDGEEKGSFFGGVDTRSPLWVLLDVYGNSTAVEFIDGRQQLNNSRSCDRETCQSSAARGDSVEALTAPMQQMRLRTSEEAPQMPALRFQPPQCNYQPMSLHRTRGRCVRPGPRGIASRAEGDFCQGYVFTARPLQLGERVVIQVLHTEPMFQGCMGLGLTSCDPATLQQSDLPDDSSFLLDRPEYWVLSRDFARSLSKGDEISFSVSHNGQVQICKNGGGPLAVIHVDHTLRLWAFMDIYGSTQKIRVLSSASSRPVGESPSERRLSATPTASESSNSLNLQNEARRQQQQQQQQLQNGGAVLSVILPPSHASLLGQMPLQHVTFPAHPSNVIVAPLTPSPGFSAATMVSTASSNYAEPVSESSSYSTPLPWTEPRGVSNSAAAAAPAMAECSICYEKPVDAVLYMCGHMCMCYECALQQWRGKGGGHCPLCRAVIRDVIRTYKS